MKHLPYAVIVLCASTCPSLAYSDSIICIAETAAGMVHNSNQWIGTRFSVDNERYLVKIDEQGSMQVKPFGTPDTVLGLEKCGKISDTNSYTCADNFDLFRIDFDTNRFVYAKTAGFTSEFERFTGMPALTPSISIGKCEKL
ncbi:hypothetical protein [Zhongshania sp.]|uniref:hypothetical protein n=1 Tax=Zhongshania sp. TaxID=1971902 RepID=UPI001B403DFC|nr:hypothetical protein [Zhongshania sp.]MBQ0797410.1 hypothetical protein [Zhongshania sp.]